MGDFLRLQNRLFCMFQDRLICTVMTWTRTALFEIRITILILNTNYPDTGKKRSQVFSIVIVVVLTQK